MSRITFNEQYLDVLHGANYFGCEMLDQTPSMQWETRRKWTNLMEQCGWCLNHSQVTNDNQLQFERDCLLCLMQATGGRA